MTRALALVGLALCLLLGAARAESHAVLRASTPPPNGTLAAGASVLALRFSETVDIDRTSAFILGDDQRRIAAKTVRVPGEPQVVRLEAEPLPPGLYTVRWQALSVDGDLTQGSFQFTVGEAAQPAQGPVAAWEPAAGEPRARVGIGLLRALMVGAIAMLTGAAFFWLEIQRLSRLPARYAGTLVVLAAAAVIGAAGSLINLAARLQTSLPGVLETTAGRLLAVMTALVLVQLGLAAAIRLRGGVPVRALLGVLVAVGVLALLTNTVAGNGVPGDDLDTATGDLLLLATAAHVAVVTLWVGGVVALVIAASRPGGVQLGQLLLRFSPWAIGAVIVLAVSGLIMAVNALDTAGDLWTSDYGRLIVLKSAGFGLLLAFGAWHRYRAAPRAVRDPTAAVQARRSLAGEALLMGAVLAVAGILAVSPQPAQPVDRLSGPPVGQVRELDFGDYQGRFLLPDPLVARTEHTLWLELRSRTFADLGDSAARLILTAPPGSTFGSRDIPLQAVAAGRWKAQGPIFPVAGEWRFHLQVTGPRGRGEVEASVAVSSDGL